MARSNPKGKRGERWVVTWLLRLGFRDAHRNHQERAGEAEAPDVTGVGPDAGSTVWAIEVKYGDHVPKALHAYASQAREGAAAGELAICVARRTGERPIVIMDEKTFEALIRRAPVDAGDFA